MYLCCDSTSYVDAGVRKTWRMPPRVAGAGDVAFIVPSRAMGLIIGAGGANVALLRERVRARGRGFINHAMSCTI